MSKQISPGELTAGLFVTVLANAPLCREEVPLMGTVAVQVTQDDNSGMGKVLRILAVDLPYVAVRDEQNQFTYSIDTRRTSLMELSHEFVTALGRTT